MRNLTDLLWHNTDKMYFESGLVEIVELADGVRPQEVMINKAGATKIADQCYAIVAGNVNVKAAGLVQHWVYGA